jgi:acyl-CoA thioester hydrolase
MEGSDPTMAIPHLHTLRVYYEDTDFSGFTYHASYLKFLERGRTEFLRALGIVQSELYREADGLAFVVSRMAVDYLKPALMDDVLTVTTAVAELRGASMVLAQTVSRDGVCLTRADVTVAAVRGGRPVRLPAVIRTTLTG